MEIEVRLFHALRRYLPAGEKEYFFRLTVPSGSVVHDALSILGIPKDRTVLIFLNGESCAQEAILSNGDVLSVMQPAGGG